MAKAPIRGTQSFVSVMQHVWKRPWLTAIEVSWRWLVGGALVATQWQLLTVLWRTYGPTSSSEVGRGAIAGGVPVWVVAFAPLWLAACVAGRTVLLRKLGAERVRWQVVAAFTAVRLLLFSEIVALWGGSMVRIARGIDWNAPSFAVQANLVPKFAAAVGVTVALFIVWSLVSWRFTMPLVAAADEGLGMGQALMRAAGQREVQSKLVEINFVMGIVKVATLVLAVTFSACPLPFQSVATAAFLTFWWIGVGLLYLVASDFFHVVRLASALELWRSLKTRSS